MEYNREEDIYEQERYDTEPGTEINCEYCGMLIEVPNDESIEELCYECNIEEIS